MVPSLTALAKTAAQPTKRLGVVYVPNGIITRNGSWTPAATEAGFEFSRIMKPLERERGPAWTVLTGPSDNRAAFARSGEALGSHSRPAAAYLTGMHAKQTQGSALDLGTSMDQFAARVLGRETRLPSLELSLEGADTFNGVEHLRYGLQLRLPETSPGTDRDDTDAARNESAAGVRAFVRRRPGAPMPVSGKPAHSSSTASWTPSWTRSQVCGAGWRVRTAPSSATTSTPSARSSGASRSPSGRRTASCR